MGAWTAAASTLDEAGTFAPFSASPNATVVSQGGVFSPTEFRALWSQSVKALRQQELAVETKVHALSPALAVSTSSSSAYVTVDTAGRRSPPSRFAMTVVWVRENGEWKALNAHQSVQGSFAEE
jgi:hypothetical protein